MASERILEALAVTAEVLGTELSKPAAKVMAMDLSDYAEDAVLEALTRCRRELAGRLTLAAIIERISDGHPGPQEAWAMLSQGMANEGVTLLWTEQMKTAFFVASALSDDMVAARMSFIEVYQRELRLARQERLPARWTVSLGHNSAEREAVVHKAIIDGRISADWAKLVLPAPSQNTAPALEHLVGSLSSKVGSV